MLLLYPRLIGENVNFIFSLSGELGARNSVKRFKAGGISDLFWYSVFYNSIYDSIFTHSIIALSTAPAENKTSVGCFFGL